jgi:nicotinamidase-related amidase
MSKEALLIIDMLNDFVLKGAPLEVPDTRKIILTIKREIQRARKNNTPVIYMCDAHKRNDVEFTKFGWPAHAVSGTRGAEVVKDLKPRRGDMVLTKKTYSSFYRTRLQNILKISGVDTLRLTGCVTHICIFVAAYEAVLRDYKVNVVKRGIAGISQEDHDAALRIMKNVLGVKLI